MKTKLRTTFLLLSAITLFLSVYACGEKSYGSGLDPKAELKTVAEIFTQADLQGRKVTVEGRIHAQCPTNGCWFVLQDDTGQIYVDLSRNGFELPPMQGRAIAATGVVSTFRGTKMMVAEGVVLK
ncbi:MAG: DNA-binding protein [Desulfatitalea sp.]|nr:DNA-binding protein [Desulfatitalea sp.]